MTDKSQTTALPDVLPSEFAAQALIQREGETLRQFLDRVHRVEDAENAKQS